MPSLFTHPAVPLATAAIAGRRLIPRPLLAVGIAFSLLPDLDGIAFLFQTPWDSPLSHRGLTHSFAFAFICAALATLFAQRLKADRLRVLAFLAICMASHGILDAFTHRGGGVALLWPLDHSKFAFGFHPILTVPIQPKRLFSAESVAVLQSELLWVWLPLTALVVLGRCLRAALPLHWSALEAALLAPPNQQRQALTAIKKPEQIEHASQAQPRE